MPERGQVLDAFVIHRLVQLGLHQSGQLSGRQALGSSQNGWEPYSHAG
jgi:hypothetical protein